MVRFSKFTPEKKTHNKFEGFLSKLIWREVLFNKYIYIYIKGYGSWWNYNLSVACSVLKSMETFVSLPACRVMDTVGNSDGDWLAVTFFNN